MNQQTYPNEKAGRVAFKDVSNRGFNKECSKHAQAVKSKAVKSSKLHNRESKSHKRNVATIYTSSHGSSKLAVNKEEGGGVNNIDIPSLQPGCAPISKAFQSKLRKPTKFTSRPLEICSPVSFVSKHYQDGPADDIDKGHSDPLLVTDYVQDMYEHFRSEEHRAVLGPFLDTQPAINDRMRAILVDWLCDVNHKFKQHPDTLYIAVNIVDRYLAKTEVLRRHLQLVGVTALMIASKYEEIYPPELRDLVYICDRTYSKFEILDMEETILKTLNYQITIPTSYKFLVRYLNAAHPSKQLCLLSSYVLEESLLSYDLTTKYPPSQLASAAILIGRKVIGRNAWSPTLLKYARYREEDIKPVARAMLAERTRVENMKLVAVQKKYGRSNMLRVASIKLPTDAEL